MRLQQKYRAKPKSQNAVQQFNDSVELLNSLPAKALDILRILGTPDCTAQYTCKVLSCSKSLVSYWKSFFIQIGALSLNDKSDVVKYYDLTPLGSKLLAMSEGADVEGRPVYVLEDFAFRFDLVRDAFEDSPIDWRRAGQPKNWDKFKFLSDGIRVILNRGLVPSVEIHPGKLRDFNPYCLMARAGEIVGRVKDELAARHGLVLSDNPVPLHKPMFQVFSQNAQDLAVATGLASLKVDLGDGEEARLDKSPPNRRWHKEFNNLDYAVADLQGPKLLVKLAERVKGLEIQVHFLSQENCRLINALNLEVEENRGLRKAIDDLMSMLKNVGEQIPTIPKSKPVVEVIPFVA